jgi:hypothetical protein
MHFYPEGPMFKKFLILMVFLVSAQASAYLIGSKLVFDRVSTQHGKGAYTIEQEVTFHEGADTFQVRENWLVGDGGNMRVYVTGNGIKIFRLLKKKRIFWIDGGSERADNESVDYFMSPLLTRSPNELKREFVRWGVLPEEALRDRPVVRDLKQINNETENFVRLARVAGTTCYAYGQPEPVVSQGPLLPGVWIEQDAFVMRKLRSPSGAEFVGNDYAPYSKNLWYPRNQLISFDNHTISIRVLSVNSVELTNDRKGQLEPSWIRGHSDANAIWPKNNLVGVIQEFYKRFR